MSEMGWASWAYCVEIAHGNKVEFYGDFTNNPHENAIVMTNHQFYCDWIYAAGSFATRFGRGEYVQILIHILIYALLT